MSILRKIHAVVVASLLCLGASAKSEDIHLRMVVWDGNDGQPVLRAEIKEFEKAHPGIRVKLEAVDYGSYFQKLLSQVAGNVAPDVVMLGAGNIQTFAKRNALIPLNQLAHHTPGFSFDDYYEAATKANTYQGKIYILQRDVAPIGIIFYNKDAFREAGIPYPDGTWTWDFEERPELKEKDFLWVMNRLTKRDTKGKVTRWGFVPSWPSAFADLLVYSQGARYVDNDEEPTKVF